VASWAMTITPEPGALCLRLVGGTEIIVTPDEARQLARQILVQAEHAEQSAAPAADLHEQYVRARCAGDEQRIRELEEQMGGERG
jgi:hypothetical protein